MEQGYFITGTDTNVGKTWATVSLMEYFKAKGKSVIGLKPVASGCERVDGKWVNPDALLLQQHANVALDYDLINPYAYELPISPHLAGAGSPVDTKRLMDHFLMVKEKADIVLVEGAGGWYSPVNNVELNCDIAKALSLPIILVVAIRLGCINHALLTVRAIAAEGMVCAAWVAVFSDPDVLEKEKIVETLKLKITVPLIGVMPHRQYPDFMEMAEKITLSEID